MRKFVYLFVVVVGCASPLALGQSRDGTAAAGAVSNTASTRSASVDRARTNQSKSRSAFGQAMADLIRSTEESRARRSQTTEVRQQDAAQVAPDHVALQSDSDGVE